MNRVSNYVVNYKMNLPKVFKQTETRNNYSRYTKPEKKQFFHLPIDFIPARRIHYQDIVQISCS